MNVFVSYSREDEAIAHLLAYILTKQGIRCSIDRELPTSYPFDTGLKNMIKDADVVLVLLTSNSISSAWVNQEIGFASAHEKRIWPVAMERDIEPTGLISTIGAYSLFDWSDPDRTIERLVETLKRESIDTQSYYAAFGADQVLTDKLQRTKFIAARLQSLNRHSSEEVIIFNQAAYSIFAFSDDEMYRQAGEHSEEYMVALKNERHAMQELLSLGNVKLRLILFPVQAYNRENLLIRFENLLNWLYIVRNVKNIEVKCGSYSGGNKLIVAREFFLEGYKFKETPGYEMSIVRYQPSRIDDAIQEFDRNWKRVGGGKEETISKLEQMKEKLVRTAVSETGH